MKNYMVIYYGLLALAVALAGVLELTPALDGVLPSEGTLVFYTEYTLAILTLGLVYLALRLIKKNPLMRILMLVAMMIANILCYHLFMVPSFFYMALIALAGYPFVYPSK